MWKSFAKWKITGVIEKFSDLRPDLLLIDWDLRLPAMNRAMVMLLRHRCPGMRILAMSSLRNLEIMPRNPV